jgi:hypothetical protein
MGLGCHWSPLQSVPMQMRYRYRIEPRPAQQRMLARVFGCCRVVFNDAVRVRDEAYQAGVKLSDSEIQRRVITQAKKTVEHGWLAEAPSVALVQSVNDSRRAWRNFFASHTGKRRGRRLGRPWMKSRKDHRQSFRLTRNGFRVHPDGRLFVAKSDWSECGGRAICPTRRRRSPSSANRTGTSTRVSSSTSTPHRYRSNSAKPGWMWALAGWRRSPPPAERARTSRIRNI